MDFSHILSCALDVGEHMLVSGAEVYRVEDSIRRICMAYGATDVDVFTITSSIVATVEPPGEQRVTQTRRIESYETDLDRVDRLNQLSREMCAKRMEYEEFQSRFQEILGRKRYPHWVEALAYALIAGAFTVFFGGTWRDMLVSMGIGVVLKTVMYLTGVIHSNKVLSNLIATFVFSVLAFLAVRAGIADTADMIIIGNIMLVIPGIGLTNSMRDIISGDTMAGILRFGEACILALAIAAGYILASMWIGGVAV